MATTGRANLIAFLLLGVAFASIEAAGKIGLYDGDGIGLIPAKDEKVFNILSYGAKPDGKTDNVENFMDAWRAACDHSGKARLLIPAGVFSLSAIVFGGPCKGISPMMVQISGVLKAVPDVSMYPSPEWLLFEDIKGLVVLGGGAVDGQGQLMWSMNDCKKNPSCARLPSSIILNRVADASVRRITSLNPMGFHFFVSQSKNVRMQRLKIIAPETSPNTDGIHISSSDSVRIARSRIETGDDCIGILQGSTRITINRITCGPGHGIRASGFLFQNIDLDNVKNPIVIDQEYCGGSKGCKMQPSQIRLSNIIFDNIVGTSVTPQAVNLRCSSAVPCQNVHFHNINLSSAKGGPTTAACTNAKIYTNGLQNPPLRC